MRQVGRSIAGSMQQGATLLTGPSQVVEVASEASNLVGLKCQSAPSRSNAGNISSIDVVIWLRGFLSNAAACCTSQTGCEEHTEVGIANKSFTGQTQMPAGDANTKLIFTVADQVQTTPAAANSWPQALSLAPFHANFVQHSCLPATVQSPAPSPV